MSIKRERKRYYNSEFKNLDVSLYTSEGKDFKGYLGDISRGGLCAILPENEFPNLKKGETLRGVLTGTNCEFHFMARIVWNTREEVLRNPSRLVGLTFAHLQRLPEVLTRAS